MWKIFELSSPCVLCYHDSLETFQRYSGVLPCSSEYLSRDLPFLQLSKRSKKRSDHASSRKWQCRGPNPENPSHSMWWRTIVTIIFRPPSSHHLTGVCLFAIQFYLDIPFEKLAAMATYALPKSHKEVRNDKGRILLGLPLTRSFSLWKSP